MSDKTLGDEVLDNHAVGAIEEVLQSVTAQSLRMARIEDSVGELRGHFQGLQRSIEQLAVRDAATTANGEPNHALIERLDEVERAAKHSAQRSAFVLFLGVLQLLIGGGLLAQSYLKLNQTEAPIAPPPVAAIKPPDPPAMPATAQAAAFEIPPPTDTRLPDKPGHGKGHHGKK
jgi:hypothetical protein